MPAPTRPRAGRAFPDLAAALLVALAVSLPLLLGPPGVTHAAPAEATLDERWAFDEWNARRRAAGSPALVWDALAYAALRDARPASFSARADAADRIGEAVKTRRGLDLAWLTLLRHSAELSSATASAFADPDVLAARYTHGTLRLEALADGRTLLVVYACELPPLLARATLNGPAGTYRVRCPNCRRESLWRLKSPRGFVSIDCPHCRTLMTPHLDDTRGALRWPPFFVRPYAPFALDNPFLAWKWVNERVLYDHPKADRDLPGWQTPQETAQLKTGVCRDTAVLLAAWLHDMGHQAQVVTGRHGEPHAWVVLTQGESRYLLESAGDGPLNRRYPPRLELATDYFPTEMIFDARGVRLNRGQQALRDYDSPQVWLPVSEQ
jgi:hypothetical protein